MGVRYRKSIKIGKGMKLNFGKKGASMSFGTKGLHYTINTSGRRTSSVGIPGTGASFVSSSGGRKRSSKRKSSGGRAKTGSRNMSYTNPYLRSSYCSY